MIESLKSYPFYKDSGSRLLGNVPSEWEIHNLRTLITARSERNRADLPLLSVAREKGVFVRSLTSNENHNTIPEDLSNYKVARAGNLVINKMKAWQGSMGISPCDGIVSPAYFVFDFRIHNGAFGQALLRSKPYVAHFGQASDGVRIGQWDLAVPKMRQIPVLVPPQAEQDAIVRFLAHINQRIDHFIHTKKKLLVLLNQQKQAMIHRGVTQGLAKNVRLKSSGMPWLGDIPVHWDVRRLKQCITKIEQGWSPQCDSQPAAENEWGVLKVGCVNKDTFNINQNKRLPRTLSAEPSLEIRDGDILMSRANTRDLLGLAALVINPRPKILLCDKLFRFKVLEKYFDPHFLVLMLRTKPIRAQIEINTNGASDSMQNIGQNVVRNLFVVVPPIEEQRQIVRALSEDTHYINKAIERNERKIALLHEYRTRLIADVVTGQVDVREAARQVPIDVVDAIPTFDIDGLADEIDLDEDTPSDD